MPMYEPESRVPRPVTVPPETRGRTTQKRVSSTRYFFASLTSSAVTMTCEVSGASTMPVTRPISTSLYLSLVLPASRPSAVANVIVMVGPFSRIDLTASQPPTSAATSGISHTSCSERPDLGATTASGTSDRPGSFGVSAIFLFH